MKPDEFRRTFREQLTGIYRPGVTAVIPTIPPRADMLLRRALPSVLNQTRPVDAVSVAVDTDHAGSALTRNRALAGVRTEWTAFLDDDDEWLPGHITALMEHAERVHADVVYPWFDVPEGFDPFPQFEGATFDPEPIRSRQNYIPVTALVRTSLAKHVGGFRPLNTSLEPGASTCDEWGLWRALLDEGAVFSHLPRRTWLWHWHGANTSGRGDRW
jgi:glycosyltransferase involved in cell wall biosynthesis